MLFRSGYAPNPCDLAIRQHPSKDLATRAQATHSQGRARHSSKWPITEGDGRPLGLWGWVLSAACLLPSQRRLRQATPSRISNRLFSAVLEGPVDLALPRRSVPFVSGDLPTDIGARTVPHGAVSTAIGARPSPTRASCACSLSC